MINSIRNKYSDYLIGNDASRGAKGVTKKAKSKSSRTQSTADSKPKNSPGALDSLKSLASQGPLKGLPVKEAVKGGASAAPASGTAASTAQANIGSF